MAKLRSFHLSVLLVFASLSLVSPNLIESPKPENEMALFVFGDSLFDSGNNQYWNGSRPNTAGNFPYGETYFKHPTGRFSDGRLISDFIALRANLPLLPPYLKPGEHDLTKGTNIASAGAGALISTHRRISINLHLQLGYFKNVEQWLKQKLGDVEAKKLLGRAVYLFSIGSNDYLNFLEVSPNANASSQSEYVEMVIGNVTTILKEIYKMGGRKMAISNVGPLGCAPIIKLTIPTIKLTTSVGDECAQLPMKLARQHNRVLSDALKKLESELPGFKYSIFDLYNSLYDRIKNPSKYGFKNVNDACCGSGPYRAVGCGVLINGTTMYELCSNPSEYVFFDFGHPTERVNSQMARLFWHGSPKITGPYNVKQLSAFP